MSVLVILGLASPVSIVPPRPIDGLAITLTHSTCSGCHQGAIMISPVKEYKVGLECSRGVLWQSFIEQISPDLLIPKQ